MFTELMYIYKIVCGYVTLHICDSQAVMAMGTIEVENIHPSLNL